MKKIRKWLSDRRDRRLREKLIAHPTFTKAGTSGIDLGKSEVHYEDGWLRVK